MNGIHNRRDNLSLEVVRASTEISRCYTGVRLSKYGVDVAEFIERWSWMMRNVLFVGTALLAAGCSLQQPAPAKVSWEYGAGNGDGVTYSGPKPVFQRAYGLGNGDGVSSGQVATTTYGYGGDGQTGTMVQAAPESPQMMAAPTPTPTTPKAVPGTHS